MSLLKMLTFFQENSSHFKIQRTWSTWDFATGILTYSTGVYAFSDCFQRNEIMWIPCLAITTIGYYFTTSSIRSLDRLLDRRPWLKCCQVMSEPALVGCAAFYLFYYRNHTEDWLKCLHFLATAVSGYKLFDRGCVKKGHRCHPTLFLPKTIEVCMGGCFLCISCTALAIYSTINKFLWPFATVFLSFWSVFGVFITFCSLFGFRQYLQVDTNLFLSIVGMTVGPVAFSSACLMFAVMEESTMMSLGAFFLTIAGQLILASSLHRLYTNVSRPLFYRYCQRVFGPILAVDSSIASAFIAYKLGWRSSLYTLPFVSAGIYAAYRGFRKVERTSAS